MKRLLLVGASRRICQATRRTPDFGRLAFRIGSDGIGNGLERWGWTASTVARRG
jgi:hypothetical protein